MDLRTVFHGLMQNCKQFLGFLAITIITFYYNYYRINYYPYVNTQFSFRCNVFYKAPTYLPTYLPTVIKELQYLYKAGFEAGFMHVIISCFSELLLLKQSNGLLVEC